MTRHAQILGVREPMAGVTYPPAGDLARHVSRGALPTRSLIAALRASFSAHAGRLALLGDGWSMSYAELDDESNRAALAFARLGLQPLDRVIFQAANSRNLVVAVLGCLKAGLIPLCTLHAHREVEIGGLGRHSAARAHFIDSTPANFDVLAFAENIRRLVPTVARTVAIAGPGGADVATLTELIQAVGTEEARAFVEKTIAAIDPFQVAFFQISGGSTGIPKIIPRFQNDYLANMEAVQRATGISAADCVVTPGPMLHNAGFACFWGPALLAGARVAILDNAREDGLARVFAQCAPTWLYMPKPLLPRLAKVFAAQPDAAKTMRGIVTSSGAREVERQLGVPTMHFYGMTEGIIIHTRPDDPPAIRHGGIGWPIAVGDEFRILKPGTEEPVASGESGEIVYRGPYVLHGYYDAPEQNRVAFTSDGWVRSGDLVREVARDGRQLLVFEGRLKDVVSRGGEKISSEEVERYLRTHAAILDVAVVPVPCPIFSERACAVLLLKPGHGCPSVVDLGSHLSGHGLAKFKWPEHVLAVDAFPVTNAGKLDKQSLRRVAAERLGRTA
ncbi:Cyclohexanecarboxylate-CoA ligase [Bosea sp. LC85]|uniref:AMP-binding protein n=1 Tax=Bosea sp. LC85 TaxID=1502851 RepID=UPI0004E44EE5|nr:AMP-binding protein [Bosea sp. LC85]KFC64827.1 Cyclohexanecarboxylate-CoA ligase [Bosea sp. LC85]